MDIGPGDTNDESAFLDDVFDLALDAAQGGAPLDLDRLLEGREALRERAEREVAEAFGLSFRPRDVDPEFSGYVIERTAGRGGMGSVYEARPRGGGERVALKLVPPDVLASPMGRQRFLREGALLARVNHPHVVRVIEVVIDGPLCALAMEWIEGDSVEEALRKKGPMTWRHVIRLGIQIADALAELHSIDLIHRDVKPGNVLLRSDGSAVLADFGIVLDQGAERLTQDGGFVGTLGFAAPEQLAGSDESVGPAADVFGLGATMLAALGGNHPFPRDSVSVYREAVERGPDLMSVRSTEASAALVRILERAVDPDPRARHTTAREFAGELRSVEAGRRLPWRPVHGVTRRLRRAKRRHPSLFVALAVGVALGLTLLVLGLCFVTRPAYAYRHLQQARQGLLDPSLSEAYFLAQRRHLLPDTIRVGSAKVRASDGQLRILETSLDHYERSLAWRSNDLAARERAILRCAIGKLSGSPLQSSQFLPAIGGAYDSAIDARIDFAARQEPLLDVGFAESLTPGEARDLGLLAHLLGDAQTAIPALRKGTSVEPPDPLASAALAMAMLSTNSRLLLQGHLETAEAAFPNDAAIQLQLADHFLGAGLLDEAGRRLERAANLDPSTRDPWNNLTMLQGEHALLRGDLELAVEKLRWMYGNRTSARARQAFAWTLEMTGDLNFVIWQLQKFLRDPAERLIHQESIEQTIGRMWDAKDPNSALDRRPRTELGSVHSPAHLLLLNRRQRRLASASLGRLPAPHPFWVLAPQWHGGTQAMSTLREWIVDGARSEGLMAASAALEARLNDGGEPADALLAPDPGALGMQSLELDALVLSVPNPGHDEYGAAAFVGDLDGDQVEDIALALSLAGEVVLVSGRTGDVLDRVRMDRKSSLGRVLLTTPPAEGGALGLMATAPRASVGAHQGGMAVFYALTGGVFEERGRTVLEGRQGFLGAAAELLSGEDHRVVLAAAKASASRGQLWIVDLEGQRVRVQEGRIPKAYLGGTTHTGLARLGDLNGDGSADYAAGAPAPYLVDTNAGEVAAWDGLTGEELWRTEGTKAGDQLGAALLGIPDVDGDGAADLIAAASRGATPGASYLVLLSGATGKPLGRWESPTSDLRVGIDLASVTSGGSVHVVASLSVSNVRFGLDSMVLSVPRGRPEQARWRRLQTAGHQVISASTWSPEQGPGTRILLLPHPDWTPESQRAEHITLRELRGLRDE